MCCAMCNICLRHEVTSRFIEYKWLYMHVSCCICLHASSKLFRFVSIQLPMLRIFSYRIFSNYPLFLFLACDWDDCYHRAKYWNWFDSWNNTKVIRTYCAYRTNDNKNQCCRWLEVWFIHLPAHFHYKFVSTWSFHQSMPWFLTAQPLSELQRKHYFLLMRYLERSE